MTVASICMQKLLAKYFDNHKFEYEIQRTVLLLFVGITTHQSNSVHTYLSRGVGTGPAGTATARPKFPEPTIKNIIALFVIKQIRNFCITVTCLHHFNKGIILLYCRKNKTLMFFKQQLRYELGACKNNSQSLKEKLNNKLPRRFLLISCYQVPRVHFKNLLKFQVSEMHIQPDWNKF